jgi:hypothetical protein
MPPAEPYTDPEDLTTDSNLWVLGTPSRDADGAPTELFWRVATIDHPGTLLKPATTTDPADPDFYHSVEKRYPIPGLLGQVRRVTARTLIRPVPYALIEDLMASGHLTTDLRPQIPTHVVEGSVLEWRTGAESCVCPNGPPCP